MMNRLNLKYFEGKKVFIFDVEANGLYNEVTKLHCIAIKNFHTGKVFKADPSQIEKALQYLSEADVLVGQNIIDYDVRAIKKLYPQWTYKAELIDTLTLSRLIYSNLATVDKDNIDKGIYKVEYFKVWDRALQKEVSAIGRHSLEAWGLRLGKPKNKFGRTTDWSTYTPPMLHYCADDVETNEEMFKGFLTANYLLEPIHLEFPVQEIITKQIQDGWEFDKDNAEKLAAKLLGMQHSLTNQLQEIFPGWYEETKTPEYYSIDISQDNYGEPVHLDAPTKGELQTKIRIWKQGQPEESCIRLNKLFEKIQTGPIRRNHIPFNPASRQHVHKVFVEKYQWKPKYWNEDKTAKVDETILKSLPYPEAKILLEYEIIKDRLEKLLGNNKKNKSKGWIECCINGRIHGYCNPLGTQTNRGSHSNPNLGQVPAGYSPYGSECRSLFIAKKGYVLVGTDASSQELRCLAHFMAKYDGGKYAKIVVSGNKDEGTDVHTINMKAAGLPDRDTAKTFIYGWLYGAGDAKLGKIISKGSREGKFLKEQFLRALPALANLKNITETQATTKGYIHSLDGRIIYCRSPHSALNFLLQSTGAILTKKWMLFINEEIKKKGLDARQVAWVHDECCIEVREDQAEVVGKICVEAMKKVEAYYNFKCELDAEYKVGKNWYEIH